MPLQVARGRPELVGRTSVTKGRLTMPQNEMVCPKCRGQMQPGFIVDEAYNRTQVSSWTPGEPKKGFFGVRAKDKKEMKAFRCALCGLLELYA